MLNKYPLWKNLMLIAIAILGFIYAIPNLYTENPVVQISAETPVDYDVLKNQIEGILQKNHLIYRSISAQDEGVEVVFPSPDTQLLARDAIKNAVGSQYTVALNLAPSTPAWYAAIRAEPMKQGLDLRGGVHFLLEVDVESVISRRYEGMMKNIGQSLREIGVRYAGIRYTADKGVNLRFRDAQSMETALAGLKEKMPDVLFTKSKTDNELIASSNTLFTYLLVKISVARPVS